MSPAKERTDEQIRIEFGPSIQPMDSWRIVLRARCDDPGDILQKVKAVMKIVAAIPRTEWPTDHDWEEMLPDWFVTQTKEHTNEAILADERLVHWEAWLDALKTRDWEWWDGIASDHEVVVFVTTTAWPYNIGPLVYLLHASGAIDVEVEDESSETVT